MRHQDVPRAQLPTDHKMTKQLCMKRIYDKIRSKSPPNRAPSPVCLHCDVTHLCLTTGIVALHIQSWRVRQREEHRHAHKTVWPVRKSVCRYQNNLYEIINHHKHLWDYFGGLGCRFKHNHNEPYQHWCNDGVWHALSFVTHATARRRELYLKFTHPVVRGNHYSFAPNIHAVML